MADLCETIQQIILWESCVDIMTRAERSERMALIRSKGTKAELAVRRLVHSMGYRYRLHGERLPGRPDLTFSKRKKVIFVHGCFWHAHKDCPDFRPPKSNRAYWKSKLERNRERDKNNKKQLEEMGWDVIVLWECEIKTHLDKVEDRIQHFLENC